MEHRQRQLFDAVSSGDVGAARAAIAAGADVNAIDFVGETDWGGYDPVGVAARLGHADVVRALIAAGAVNRVFIESALTRPAVVRAWLDAVATDATDLLNAAGEQGLTVLMLAARAGLPETVRLLLSAGADPTLVDETGRTALAIAEQRLAHVRRDSEADAARLGEVVEILRSAGA